jgi:anti-sigma factor RsiW
MDCNKFEHSLSEYLDGELDSRVRTECAAHRLICRSCRELYNDVRSTVQALNGFVLREEDPEGLTDRILAATTTGEMLNCNEFDRLLERYFDGVILAPTFQNFQSHFGKCPKCRRLMAGIEDAIGMCREAKDVELAIPDTLHDRIVAATLGPQNTTWFGRSRALFFQLNGELMNRLIGRLIGMMWKPSMAAAGLIFAASSLFIISRFGSVSGMAEHAESKARRIVIEGEKRLSDTQEKTWDGLRNVSEGVHSVLFSGAEPPAAVVKPRPPRSSPSPTPKLSRKTNDPTAIEPQSSNLSSGQ